MLSDLVSFVWSLEVTTRISLPMSVFAVELSHMKLRELMKDNVLGPQSGCFSYNQGDWVKLRSKARSLDG